MTNDRPQSWRLRTLLLLGLGAVALAAGVGWGWPRFQLLCWQAGWNPDLRPAAQLERALASSHVPARRWAAAQLVAWGGGADGLALALRVVHDPDATVAGAGIEALVRLREPAALPVLCALISEAERTPGLDPARAALREQAGRALDAFPVYLVAPLADDPSPVLRCAALGSLARGRVRQALNRRSLAALAGDADAGVRRAFDSYLAVSGDDPALLLDHLATELTVLGGPPGLAALARLVAAPCSPASRAAVLALAVAAGREEVAEAAVNQALVAGEAVRWPCEQMLPGAAPAGRERLQRVLAQLPAVPIAADATAEQPAATAEAPGLPLLVELHWNGAMLAADELLVRHTRARAIQSGRCVTGVRLDDGRLYFAALNPGIWRVEAVVEEAEIPAGGSEQAPGGRYGETCVRVSAGESEKARIHLRRRLALRAPWDGTRPPPASTTFASPVHLAWDALADLPKVWYRLQIHPDPGDLPDRITRCNYQVDLPPGTYQAQIEAYGSHYKAMGAVTVLGAANDKAAGEVLDHWSFTVTCPDPRPGPARIELRWFIVPWRKGGQVVSLSLNGREHQAVWRTDQDGALVADEVPPGLWQVRATAVLPAEDAGGAPLPMAGTGQLWAVGRGLPATGRVDLVLQVPLLRPAVGRTSSLRSPVAFVWRPIPGMARWHWQVDGTGEDGRPLARRGQGEQPDCTVELPPGEYILRAQGYCSSGQGAELVAGGLDHYPFRVVR